MKVSDLLEFINTEVAPFEYQENYDNAGLLTGNSSEEVTGVLVCLDSIETTIDEAIHKKCNVVVAHHPIVFSGLKSLTGKNYIERTLIKAIQHNIALVAVHTNIDNQQFGVSYTMAKLLGLTNIKVLQPKFNTLYKFVAFGVPKDIEALKKAVFEAGGGQIGNYSECSFRSTGEGTYKALANAKPTLGEVGKQHIESEERIEFLVPKHLVSNVLEAAKKASTYEELAYDLIAVENSNETLGSGAIGELKIEIDNTVFLKHIKSTFGGVVRYTKATKSKVCKVALCGGSGGFLLNDAIKQKADVFITADFKYHQFFDADSKIQIADIGHYESEACTIQLLADLIREKFPTFAVHLTEVNTNPVNYL